MGDGRLAFKVKELLTSHDDGRWETCILSDDDGRLAFALLMMMGDGRWEMMHSHIRAHDDGRYRHVHPADDDGRCEMGLSDDTHP